jgi:hypothetical protein
MKRICNIVEVKEKTVVERKRKKGKGKIVEER